MKRLLPKSNLTVREVRIPHYSIVDHIISSYDTDLILKSRDQPFLSRAMYNLYSLIPLQTIDIIEDAKGLWLRALF